jgi:TM2 domain-containing membrane protein YozV
MKTTQSETKCNAFLAGLVSLMVPGLGQFYCGERDRGAAILVAAIVVGSLNILFIPIFVAADPNPEIAWAYWIPRIGHDLISVWSVVFWAWVVADAFLLARRG